ncbi:unnamed protein product [Ectocarpus sp. 4 AP-2014]
MIMSSSLPQQRVHGILQRMQTDLGNVECLKTCCGALAILAKDESNKLLIARDGTRLILTVMEGHATRPDLQEAVCDLLWSLAFNNGLVKEVVGRQGGIALILKGMSSHLSSPELIKSACGALSNMCQNTYNQNLIAAHGGVRTILSALQSHRMNAPLLPFVFDALASLIVGNQRNGLLVTDGGGIRAVLTTMALHSGRREVVKSGCHTLAILSDIQGQGARIAGADGVKVLLPALRAHVRFLHLHRIAAIVLLRMLQEAAVARDIASYGGVVIMLGMLREHAAEEETVAATVHILYLITHADVMRGEVEVEVGRHFSGIPPPSFVHGERSNLRGIGVVPASSRGGGGGLNVLSGVGTGSSLTNGGQGGGVGAGLGGGVDGTSMADRELFSTGSVRALVLVLQAHMERKDIVRAAMRSAANLIRMPSVVLALVSEASALPTVLQCLALHTTSRGITDSAVAVAGALLAAAHEGGWTSTIDLPKDRTGWGNEAIATSTGNEGEGGRGCPSKLFVLATASNGNNKGTGNNTGSPNDRGQQQLQRLFPRQHQHQHQHQQSALNAAAAGRARSCRVTPSPIVSSSIGNNSSRILGLRFAYAPLQDNPTTQGGAKSAATGAPVTTSSAAAAAAVGGDTSGSGTRRRGSGPSNGPIGAGGTAAMTSSAARVAIEAGRGGSRGQAGNGDSGGWNASMQALCAMLRARRRDPNLAGLVFMALKACIIEWAHACDAIAGASSEQQRQQREQQQQQQQREQQNSFGAMVARGRGWRGGSTSGPGDGKETAAAPGTAPAAKPQFSSSPRGEQLSETTTIDTAAAVAAAAGNNAAPDRSSHKGAAASAAITSIAAKGIRRDGKDTAELTVTPRGKMHLGIREVLKAGLVWAEAVPLFRAPEAGMNSNRRLANGEQAAAAAAAAGDVSFSPAMAQAVERLCGLLDKGFAEMGFGRFGGAVPLGEAISLVAFDVCVPEVLKNLRAARQPSDSREGVEHLMRTFLLDDPPEPDEVDQDSALPAAPPAATLSSAAAKADGSEQASDDRSTATGAVIDGDAHDSSGGKNTGGGGDSGRSGSPANSRGRGGSAFVDEAAADGAGLMLSSPTNLEPFLLPSASSLLMTNSSLSAAAVTATPPAGVGGGIGATLPHRPGGGGALTSAAGAPNPSVGAAAGLLSYRYPVGASGGGGAMGSDDRLWLVYDGDSAAGKGVVSKVNAPDPYWLGRAPPGAVCPHRHSMEFFSSFESANLLRAVQRGPAEYDLFLRPDLHTHGHTQWFYFAVRGTHPPGVVGDSVIKFNVVNLTKPDSLFAMGMRPVMYSHKDAEEKGLGWRRCGHGIDYRSNGYSWYKPDGSHASFYTLSLSVTFPNSGDSYRLAHAHPYSYSDHKRHLAGLLENERTSRYLNHTILCKTLGGNDCDLLTVTDPHDTPIIATGIVSTRGSSYGSSPPSSVQQQQHQGQQQHVRHHGAGVEPPGVSTSSNNSGNTKTNLESSETTTEEAIAAAAPVAGGAAQAGAMNGSGGLGGEDIGNGSLGVGEELGGRYGLGGMVGRRGMNKRCVVISARVHPGETPASWMMRGMLDFLTGDNAEARLLRSLFVFKIVPMLNPDGVAFGNNRCSLAGVDLNRQWKRPSRALHPTVFWLKQHIRQEQAKKGVAMYIDLHGHSRKMNIFMYGADEKRRGVSCPSARVFPKLLSWNRLGRKYVSFKECSFAVKKGREATARVVVARDLGIGNSYTVESTFCGVDFGPLKDHHLNSDHLQEAGVAICDALLDYYVPNQAQRERAHSDLMARDGIEGSRLGLLNMPPPNGTIFAAAVSGGGGSDVEPSADGESNGGRGAGRSNVGGCGAAGEEGGAQRMEGLDVDDDVVDNNDDIESEDDNDSADAAAGAEAELEASPEETDPDNPSDADPPFTATPSPQSTLPPAGVLAQARRAPSSSPRIGASGQEPPRRTGGKDSAIDPDAPLVLARRGGGGGGGSGSSEVVAEHFSGGATARNRAKHEQGEHVNGGGGGGDGEEAGVGESNKTNPWAGIEWGQGEGKSGDTVRRWGRVVQEVDGYGLSEIGANGDLEIPPTTGDAGLGGSGKEEGRRSSTSLGKAGSRTEATGEEVGQAAIAAVAVAATRTKVTTGEPPPPSGRKSRKERRRASGSRAPKALALSGNRGRGGSERSIVVRQHRPRGSCGNGGSSDDAARRASDAALQAASNVLAACASNSTTGGPIGKPRRRVCALPDNGHFTPNSGSGSGASRSSASSTSTRGGASSGRSRGGGMNLSFRGGIGSGISPTVGTPESAPRSGSSLVDSTQDGGRGGGGGNVATAGVVKRGGNPRWLSPTNITTGSGMGGAEGDWSERGSLASNIVQRVGSVQQSPFHERDNSDAVRSSRQQAEVGAAAPEIGVFSGGGGGGAKGLISSGDVVGGLRGRIVKGRGVIAVGVGGERTADEKPTSVPAALFALPVLEDGGGGCTSGTGARGMCGRKIQA